MSKVIIKPFRFRQFNVYDHLSTMKIGTDAVLLGAWASPPQSGNLLDVGTGCGIIALMMAQKTVANITAIDIHADSIAQAVKNFRLSPWPHKLEAFQISLEDFSLNNSAKFDFIISNPPFFINSLKPKQPGKLLAKHAHPGFVDAFLDAVASLLKPEGRAAFIMPPQLFELVLERCLFLKMYPVRKALVYTNQCTTVSRIMIEIGMILPVALIEETIFIRDGNQQYSTAYKFLTQDFYLFLNE